MCELVRSRGESGGGERPRGVPSTLGSRLREVGVQRGASTSWSPVVNRRGSSPETRFSKGRFEI